MPTHCPSCNHVVEIDDFASSESLTCSSCGVSFTPLPEDELSVTLAGTAAPTNVVRIPGSHVGRYRIDRVVGQGVSGQVWKAFDTLLDRTVALKSLGEGSNVSLRPDLFLREARFASRLNHPLIVQVYDVFTHKNETLLVREFIDGRSLRELMRESSPSVERTVRLCIMIADALHHAHTAGVIHRDIKPSNIILDRAGAPHLTDFGLARKINGRSELDAGAIVGTPAYLSPEQAQAKPVDVRSDIYSLGVVLFEMLTGQRLIQFTGKELVEQIAKKAAPSLCKLNSEVPPDVDWICRKCLEKDPELRYSTALEFANDLRRLPHPPVTASPVSFAAKLIQKLRQPSSSSAIRAARANEQVDLVQMEREKAEHEFRARIDALSKREAAANLQFIQSLDELTKRNEELEAFAYIASHDLKEPLRGISHLCGFLLEDYAAQLEEEGVSRLKRMQELCSKMGDLIDSLLKYSRLGFSRLELCELDFNELLAEVCESLDVTIKEQRVSIRVPRRLPTIPCDKTLVNEILRNLITNAIKYNDKPEKLVEVGCFDKPTCSPPWDFYVRDNGVGIRPEHRDEAFKLFKRLHSPAGFEEGNGAGLTIVKKCVERHGGRIRIESQVGRGSTFYFSLGKELHDEA